MTTSKVPKGVRAGALIRAGRPWGHIWGIVSSARPSISVTVVDLCQVPSRWVEGHPPDIQESVGAVVPVAPDDVEEVVAPRGQGGVSPTKDPQFLITTYDGQIRDIFRVRDGRDIKVRLVDLALFYTGDGEVSEHYCKDVIITRLGISEATD